MDIYFLGLNAIRIKGKKTTLIVDPFSKEKTGIPFEKSEADAVLLTSEKSPFTSLDGVEGFRVLLNGPGEYEVGGASIVGVLAGGVTTYYIKMDGIALLHLGELKRPLSDSEFDKYPNIDIVFVPVGGGMSINGKDAAAMIAKLEPKIIVPINFKTGDKEKMELDGIEIFLKEIGREVTRPQPKLSVTGEKLPQELEVVWLS